VRLPAALRPPTLRGRLALAATLATAAVLLVVVVAVVAAFAARERAATDRTLATQAARLEAPARFALQAPPGHIPRGLARQAARLLAGSGTGVRVRGRDGIVFDNGEGPETTAPLGYASRDGWRVLTRALGGGATLQLAVPEADAKARVAHVRTIAIVAGALGVLGCAVLVYAVAGVALRPLGVLRAGAARVSTTRDLTARLPERDGPEELDDLARSLNAMLARLEASAARTEEALAAARRFTADAGHELRTPLTSLRANVETLVRNPGLPAAERARVLEEVVADQARLAALLDGLQSLARGDADVANRETPLDLADVADAAVAAARRRHPALTVALRADEPAPVRGAEEGLRALVDNLLENAARHGRPDGRVEVAVGGEDGRVVLTVDDDGPGIPPGERERVLARFARGTGARGPGSGLGLAIVAQQAALHGGRVEVGEAPLGGARVRVALPPS